MRVEVMQLLDEAFRILDADDIKRLFGADNAWDVVEEVLIRYFNERLVTSPRQRMGVAGREVLRWLGQPHILQKTRPQFEALLLEIAEFAEEWLTSAQAMGLAERRPDARVLPWDRTAPAPRRNGRADASARAGVRGRSSDGRDFARIRDVIESTTLGGAERRSAAPGLPRAPAVFVGRNALGRLEGKWLEPSSEGPVLRVGESEVGHGQDRCVLRAATSRRRTGRPRLPLRRP